MGWPWIPARHRRRVTKQKKPGQQHSPKAPTHTTIERDVDPTLLDQEVIGNAALQSQVEGGVVAEPIDFDVVRDAALPLVERSALALEMDGLEADKFTRLQQVVTDSLLPDDRKAAMLERLGAHQEMASTVSDALVQVFGNDSEATRAAVADTLQAVSNHLRSSEGLDVAGESVSARAGALAQDVANTVSSPELGTQAGDAIRRFCRTVSLSILFDDEEEEEEVAWFGPIGIEQE